MSNILFSIDPIQDVQEITLSTCSGKVFQFSIIKENNDYSGALTSSNNCLNYMQPTTLSNPKSKPEDVFEEIVDSIINYLSKSALNDNINDVCNPCNTRFIDSSSQEHVLQKKGITLQVRVS